MFDFLNFIEILNKNSKGVNTLRNALDSVKEPFHIGKILAKSEALSDCFEYVIDENIIDEPILSYKERSTIVHAYKINDGYKYNDSDKKDLGFLLRLIYSYFDNYVLLKKLEDGEFISLNTKLPNSHGYLREIAILNQKIDGRNYNAYYINLKRFGLINNQYGSKICDDAIKAFAGVLKNFKEDDEIIGHLGGDNFVALIKRTRHKKFIDIVTDTKVTVYDNYNKPINIDIIGVVGYDEINSFNIDYSMALSNPSMACQYARNTKKLVVKLTDDLIEMLNSAKHIESTFNEELNKGNFMVYYQPKFDINTEKIIGVEALSRWKNNGKIVPPGVFVPILEKNGEIVKLDLYVLESLCRDIGNYRNMGHNIVPASCNLSRRDFEIDNLEEMVINIIKKYNVKTEDIVIEVTETTNLEENERLSKFISIMHDNGIMTSVDDFGTGYSSLSVLRDFKVNEIKIDRSFINREELNKSDAIIIGSIIDMAKRLNIDVICEGVETDIQARFLVKLGCDRAQGYLYSKPVPKLEFESMLQTIGTIYDKEDE